MNILQDFLHMGGYATFVWSAYGIWAAVMIWIIISVRMRDHAVRKQLLRDLQAEELRS